MSDLIRRDDVIDLIMETDPFWAEGTTRAIFNGVEKIRVVSCVEPIVRCKDCKHNSLNRISGNTYCDLGIGLYQLYDFCSMGERKDDETD